MTPVRFTAFLSTALMLLTLWAQVGHITLVGEEAFASEGASAPHVALGEASGEAGDGDFAGDDDAPPLAIWFATPLIHLHFSARVRDRARRPAAFETPPSRLLVATPSRGPPARA